MLDSRQKCYQCAKVAFTCGWCRWLPGYSRETIDDWSVQVDPRGIERRLADDFKAIKDRQDEIYRSIPQRLKRLRFMTDYSHSSRLPETAALDTPPAQEQKR